MLKGRKHVIGIDPSLSNTAICRLFENGTHQMSTHKAGKAVGPGVLPRISRLQSHAANIVADVVASQADLVMILLEGYSYSSRGSVILLAEFGGLLRAQLRSCYLLDATREVSPATLKQFVVKGNAKKAAVIGALARRYGVQFDTDDEYDAFGLAKLAACAMGWETPSNEGQRKAVAKIQG